MIPFTNEKIHQKVCTILGATDITESAILAITELDLSRMGLTDIADLAMFKNLRKLNLTENCLRDLSPLAGLTSLEVLSAGNDPFLSEEELAKRPGKNHFEDYRFLKNLPNLTDVEFTDTDITDIAYAVYLPNVREFRAYSNPITDVSPLAQCPKLYKAYFYNCPITDISFLRELPDDTFGGIAVNCTGVSDISPLDGKINLDYLDAHDSQVEDISVLRGMNRLRYCTLDDTHVRDLTPLHGLEGFGWLKISGLPVEKSEILLLASTFARMNLLDVYGYSWTEEEIRMLKTILPPGCEIGYDAQS